MTTLIRALLVSLTLTLGFAACAGPGSQLAYDGPMPSAAAVELVKNLRGQTLTDNMGALGGGAWEVGAFGVRTGQGGTPQPLVNLTSGTETKRIPLLKNGDVNDLFHRIRGKDSSLGASEMSAAYRSAFSR